MADYVEELLGVIKGDTRSVDFRSDRNERGLSQGQIHCGGWSTGGVYPACLFKPCI